MLTLTMTKGLPGSGKTTWAMEQLRANPGSTKRVNKDELRAMLDAGHHSKGNEAFVLKVRDRIIREALDQGRHVIVDDTNLHPKHAVALESIVREVRELKGSCQLVVKSFLHVPIEECIANDLKRLNSVGEAVIRRMHREHVEPAKPRIAQVPHRDDLPDCIIVDLDGTLALMKDRGPFEWMKVGQDGIHEDIRNLLMVLQDEDDINPGVQTIICSGRDEVCRPQTEAWLDHYGIVRDALHMRPAGSMEKDVVVKERMYREHIEGKYNVLFVLDDRDQVVRMWRNLGLRCLQVADGNF